ncbi:flagellar biosynthetic protein FliP [Aliiruegeria haliotis]|uniref:Flagellar biosynthetic protein FliP n=1 Tax=Aliiruegeria haliotis TaxID=1280846 RepID=A0A2T0RTD9_9RHOB|nr:flagellar type III secretion system pore protein FliP [Aliiruegeria haliotis]PRY24412.1 flagellar biosynthetic protein FliP [Aliiruegeria haliotis]
MWAVARRQCPLLLAAAFVVLASVGPGVAQDIELSFGESGSLTANSLQIFFLVGLIGFAPGLLIMATSFPFIVTVLSILRQAIGLQQSPPNMLIISVALVLTYYVMDPVFLQAWNDGLGPAVEGTVEIDEALRGIMGPFREFMMARVDPETLGDMFQLRLDTAAREIDVSEPPNSVLIPAFLLGEISRAFEIGFLVFIPFLIIDLVVAAILMSMGMMMVPPAMVSLPFKLAFFAIADGWLLISRALVEGYF